MILEHKQLSGEKHSTLNILSSDALLISASPAIQLVLAAFRFLLNEKDEIARVELVQANAMRLKASINDKTLYRKEIKHQLSLLPAEFTEQKNKLIQLSLYEATENLIAQFSLDAWTDEQPYLLAFLDLVNSFSAKGKPSIRDFIRWWTEEGYNSALPLSSASNAIQVLTIHKSKGLAFDMVIVPYADWKLKSDKGLLWCDWKMESSELEVLPVEIQSSLAETVFAYEYFEEMLMSRMDALNLLYVALTRAKQGIFLTAPLPSPSKAAEEKTMSTIADLIYKGLDQKQEYLINAEPEAIELPNRNDSLKILPNDQPFNPLQVLREPAQSEQVLKSSGGDQQKIGQLAHLVLSTIQSPSDLPDILKRMQLHGILNSTQLKPVEEHVRKVFTHSELGTWLRGNYTILNEKSILLPGGMVRRPDKILYNEKETILLDFKFTQEATRQHAKQLKEYSELLVAMGYPQVKAFIYYGFNQSLVPLQSLPHQQGTLFGNE